MKLSLIDLRYARVVLVFVAVLATAYRIWFAPKGAILIVTLVISFLMLVRWLSWVFTSAESRDSRWHTGFVSFTTGWVISMLLFPPKTTERVLFLLILLVVVLVLDFIHTRRLS